MWFSSWLRQGTAGRAPRGPAQRRPAAPRFRPRLESLEDRLLPSQVNLTVSSLADAGLGTLRAAIQTADAGSHSDKFTINFAVAGMIDLQSPLPDLNNSITIQGPGASSLTVEPATGVSLGAAVVTVDAGQTASLSGLTVANGTGSAFGDGGGINNAGTLMISGCTLSGNSAGFGGAIWNGGTLTVSNSTLTRNAAIGLNVGAGGAIYNIGGSSVTVIGSALSRNHAVYGGGAISNYGTLTVSGSTLSDNSTPNFGGGIFSDGTLSTVSGSTLSGNSAGLGGGLFSGDTLLTVSGSTFSGNSAGQGGGLFGVAFTVRGCTFSGNSAIDGGGIFSLVTATVRDSLFTDNSATEGGGIYNAAGSTLQVQNSILSGNTASDSGGGIYNLGSATVQQNTLSGNTAGSDGGGIFNGASGTLAVKDSTVLGNTAPGGADLYTLGSLVLDDSTVGVIGP
jgi:parallel beta-helix repeat protein